MGIRSSQPEHSPAPHFQAPFRAYRWASVVPSSISAVFPLPCQSASPSQVPATSSHNPLLILAASTRAFSQGPVLALRRGLARTSSSVWWLAAPVKPKPSDRDILILSRWQRSTYSDTFPTLSFHLNITNPTQSPLFAHHLIERPLILSIEVHIVHSAIHPLPSLLILHNLHHNHQYFTLCATFTVHSLHILT